MEVPVESVSLTKKCPFCAEEILLEAKKCRHCGEFLDTSLSSGKNEMLPKALAVVGSLLLLVAPFAPMLSFPTLSLSGGITLFQQGRTGAVLLMVIALIALGLSLMGRYVFLWFSGALGLKVIGDMFYFAYERIPVVFGISARGQVDPDWGALILLVGTLTTLGVAISNWITRRALTLPGKIGLILVVLVVTYEAVMLCFPYLRLWPSLF